MTHNQLATTKLSTCRCSDIQLEPISFYLSLLAGFLMLWLLYCDGLYCYIVLYTTYNSKWKVVTLLVEAWHLCCYCVKSWSWVAQPPKFGKDINVMYMESCTCLCPCVAKCEKHFDCLPFHMASITKLLAASYLVFWCHNHNVSIVYCCIYYSILSNIFKNVWHEKLLYFLVLGYGCTTLSCGLLGQVLLKFVVLDSSTYLHLCGYVYKYICSSPFYLTFMWLQVLAIQWIWGRRPILFIGWLTQ